MAPLFNNISDAPSTSFTTVNKQSEQAHKVAKTIEDLQARNGELKERQEHQEERITRLLKERDDYKRELMTVKRKIAELAEGIQDECQLGQQAVQPRAPRGPPSPSPSSSATASQPRAASPTRGKSTKIPKLEEGGDHHHQQHQ